MRRFALLLLGAVALAAADEGPGRRKRAGKPSKLASKMKLSTGGLGEGGPGAGAGRGGSGGMGRAGRVPGGAIKGKRPTFETMSGLLKAYKEENGHVDVPIDAEAEGPSGRPVKLGRWLAAIRRAGAAGKLKEEHKSALDEIDPKWTETTQEIPEPRARRAPPSAGKAAGKKRRGTPKDD